MSVLACDNCRPVPGAGWYALIGLAIAAIVAGAVLAHRVRKGSDRRYPKVFAWIIVAAVVVGVFASIADLTVVVGGQTVLCFRLPDMALMRGLPNDGALDADQLGCKYAARHRLESAAFGVAAVSLPLMAIMVMAASEDRRRLRVVRTSPQMS